MFRGVLGEFVTATLRVQRRSRHAVSAPSSVFARSFSDVKDEGRGAEEEEGAPPPFAFDTGLLDFLVCPLSKKPLRYEARTNELINEELGIAYPIADGIPNMIPQDARLIQKDTATETTATTQE